MEAAQSRDSFIYYKPLLANFSFIQKNGVYEFALKELKKQKYLLQLLDGYDDGRSKLFYCTACQLLPMENLNLSMRFAEDRVSGDADIKEKSKIMRGAISKLADKLSIDLKLRKFE